MEYIYGAMLLHTAGKTITEDALKKVIDATGEKSSEQKRKAMIASLDGVDINKAISEAAIVSAAPAAAGPAAKEEKKEEKVDEGAASAGLGALFG